MLFQVNAYIDYGFLKVPRYTNAADLVRDGFYAFVDADGARTMLETAAAAGVDEVHFFGMLPGEDVDSASRRCSTSIARSLRRPLISQSR